MARKRGSRRRNNDSRIPESDARRSRVFVVVFVVVMIAAAYGLVYD